MGNPQQRVATSQSLTGCVNKQPPIFDNGYKRTIEMIQAWLSRLHVDLDTWCTCWSTKGLYYTIDEFCSLSLLLHASFFHCFQVVSSRATRRRRRAPRRWRLCTTPTSAPCTPCRGTPASPRTSSRWATGARGSGRRISRNLPSCGQGPYRLTSFKFPSAAIPEGGDKVNVVEEEGTPCII